MGGTGSGRRPNEQTIVNRMIPEPKTPIADDFFLPNVSVLSGGGHKKVIVSGDATDATEARTLNIIFGTDETPPTASNYPIGTIYIQYTA